MHDQLAALRNIMDRLDNEDDDAYRADLIDDAIGLADHCRDCAQEWADYR
jgi:hypothetical protein